MPFQLHNIHAKLTSVTPREESHGESKVFAITLSFKITGGNTILDNLDGGNLRNAIYMAAPDQDELPGVEPSTPLLRTHLVKTIALSCEFDGWTLKIPHGINEDEPITMGDSSVKGFKLVPHQGGSVDLSFNVGSNDISAHEAGLMCARLGQEIEISLTAPTIAGDTPAIDGSTEAFRRDHPEAEGQRDLLGGDATDIFAGMRGDDTGAPGAGDSDEGDWRSMIGDDDAGSAKAVLQ